MLLLSHTDAFQDGRLVVAISKLDHFYCSETSDNESETSGESDLGSDSECESEEEHKSMKFKRGSKVYADIEATTKTTLCKEVLQATQCDLPPHYILSLCGKWAFKSQKLQSILPVHESHPKEFEKRFSAACKALSGHPNRQDINIPCPQGMDERDAIIALAPTKVVEYLDRVTGLEELRRR